MNTNYFLDCVAGNVFQTKISPAIPTEYFLGLSTTAPNLEGGGVSEPAVEAGYARVKLTSLSEPEDGVVTNTQTIDFAESTGDWGTVTYFVVYDAAEANTGNLLMYGELTTPRTVETATILSIKAGYLELSVLNPT